MKTWFLNRSIYLKLLMTGGATILFIVVSAIVIMAYFFNKSYTADQIHGTADKIKMQMLLARIAEKNFIQNDLNNKIFYITGTSTYLEENNAYLSNVQDEILNLIKLLSGTQKHQANELLGLLDRYRLILTEMVKVYRKRGFKDWGLLGEWRQAIHNVESSVSQMNRSDIQEAILQLRRLEKDYLLRKESKYLDDIKNQLAALRGQILASRTADVGGILKEIDQYEKAFKQYLFLQRKIGQTEKEGLQKDFAGVINEIKPAVDRILDQTRNADQKARHDFMTASIFIYFFGIGLGCAVSYFFARSISMRLTALKNAALSVGRGHLDTKIDIDTKDEIGIVAKAFNTMTTDLNTITVSKNYVDKIIASMADMLIVINPEMEIKTVNHATLDVLAYQEEELLGRRLSLVLNDLNSDRGFLEEFIRKQYIRNVEKEYIRRDGSKIPVVFSGASMTDDDGNILGIVCLAQDNTERKSSEEALKKTERELRILSLKILEAQENERKRVARELHDGIGQALTGIKFCLENGLRKIEEGKPFSQIQEINNAIPLIRATVEETRRIAMGLRPSTLDDIGIAETLYWFCQQFEEIYTITRIETSIEIEENQMTDSLKTTIFRVTQEALNNVAKHSRADRVLLRLHKVSESIELTIADNGIGFEIEKHKLEKDKDRGFGLASMKERAELSGGSLSIRSALGQGTRIKVLWPALAG
jgi:PAS domain S-box-containing protein